MSIPDLINGIFEIGGAIFCWFNVKKLYKDKMVSGVYWPVQGWFTLWGFYNIFFYSHLNQWLSVCGGVVMLICNLVWVIMARFYSKRITI